MSHHLLLKIEHEFLFSFAVVDLQIHEALPAKRIMRDMREIMSRAKTSRTPSDGDGHTTLMCAALDGRTAAVKALLGRGANANARDDEGRTALMFAVINLHGAPRGPWWRAGPTSTRKPVTARRH